MDLLLLAALGSAGYFLHRNMTTTASVPDPPVKRRPAPVERMTIPAARRIEQEAAAKHMASTPLAKLPLKENAYSQLAGSTIEGGPNLLPMNQHHNMVPFYRGELKQNMKFDSMTRHMETFTGSGGPQAGPRQERAPLFSPASTTDNIHGMPSTTDFQQSRVVAPQTLNKVRPMEPVRVGPGIGGGFGSAPMGGFQQLEVRDAAMPRNVDQLRSLANPKAASVAPAVIPGQKHIMPSKMGMLAKNRPDTTHEVSVTDLHPTTGPAVRQASQAAPIVRPTQRLESVAYSGGAYKPMGAGDYGKSGMIVKPDTRPVVTYNGANLTNIVKKMIAPLQDMMRPTPKKAVTSQATQQHQRISVQIPGKRPVQDPTDVPRTTLKQTITESFAGTAGGQNMRAAVAQKAPAYDPSSVPRTTTKETTTVDELSYTRIATVPEGNQGNGYITTIDGLKVPVTRRDELLGKDGERTSAGATGVGAEVGGYQVADVDAPPTQRQTLGDNEHVGVASVGPDGLKPPSYEDMYNALVSDLKHSALVQREPTQTSDKVAAGADTVNIEIRRQGLDTLDLPTLPSVLTNWQAQPRVETEGQRTRAEPDGGVDENMRLDPNLLAPYLSNPLTQPLTSVA